MKKLAIAIAGIALASNTASADQCQWVDAAAAAKAEAIMAKKPKAIAFCEPCGDKVPGVPVVASLVEVTTPDPGYKELHINGDAVDLAYTFVRTSSSKYTNLAMLVDCHATGVSRTLSISDETPNGVLITASDDPPPPPVVDPDPVIAQVPVPAIASPPVVMAPPAVYVYTTTNQLPMPWYAIAIAIASLAGFSIGALGLLTEAALRRRRAMKPRATDLRSRID